MPSPLQNRVLPDGEIVAVPERGHLMGNRGGRIHRDDRTLGTSRWKSRAWIACVTEFKNRHREVMGASYTELFFHDEVVALAAGHRPCFECRRQDANRFAELWTGTGNRARAADMDRVLHEERRRRPRHEVRTDTLPTGAMVQSGSDFFAVTETGLRLWSWQGYGPVTPHRTATLLTPPAIIRVLERGYAPFFA